MQPLLHRFGAIKLTLFGSARVLMIPQDLVDGLDNCRTIKIKTVRLIDDIVDPWPIRCFNRQGVL